MRGNLAPHAVAEASRRRAWILPTILPVFINFTLSRFISGIYAITSKKFIFLAKF